MTKSVLKKDLFGLKRISSWHGFRGYLRSFGSSNASNKRKGDVFEFVVKIFFETQPEYAVHLKKVWLESEIPASIRKELNLPSKDRGIDIVAQTKDGDFWAIQAKYRHDTKGALTLTELGTFGTQVAAVSDKIKLGIICATKQEKTSDFTKAKGVEFKQVLLPVWETLDTEFWNKVHAAVRGHKPNKPTRHKPRPYQLKALSAAKKHFISQGNRRGKLIMPCGTGKSLLGYWTAIRSLKAKRIVVAVPSLALIGQTYRDWAREAIATGKKFRPLLVCSDNSTGEGDATTDELSAPVTTDPTVIRKWLKTKTSNETLNVVFVTYQSGAVFAKAAGNTPFDVGIFDEAHKTAGTAGKQNQHLLKQKNIRIQYRIFMTATEKYYDGESDEIIGMNETKLFGEIYHSMSFSEAIDKKYLADYRVVIMAIDHSDAEKYRSLIEDRVYVDIDGDSPRKSPISADDLAAAIALRKAMKKYSLTHAVSFHSRITLAQQFSAMQSGLNGKGLSSKLDTFQVSSKQSSGQRFQELRGFEESYRAIISNARCLTEGVDVPSIDLVLFAQPRKSKIDIVQAVGRALRLDSSKPGKIGYVLVPMLLDENNPLDLEKAAKGTGFENIVTVLKALGSVDGDVRERIVFSNSEARARSSYRSDASKKEILKQKLDAEEFASAIQLRAIDRLDGLMKQRLSIEQILRWADKHKEKKGSWPNESSGQIAYSDETWNGISSALAKGGRGLPGNSSLAKLLKEKRGKRNHLSLPRLTIEWILSRADEYKAMTGKWPNTKSGTINGHDETWVGVEVALTQGLRGLQKGNSLAKVLYQNRNFKHPLQPVSISIKWILARADEHKKKVGEWPKVKSGKIIGYEETWLTVDNILRAGGRALPKKSSLAKLLHNKRGVRNQADLPKLNLQWILSRADEYKESKGNWPNAKSGPIAGTDETWGSINAALSMGLRGLAGESSLAKLLAKKRGLRVTANLAALTVDWILARADDHKKLVGKWPKVQSGKILGFEETWSSVNACLSEGLRGLPGGTTLAKLLKRERNVSYAQGKIKLSIDWILAHADEHRRKTGKWPTSKSGKIEGTEETWGIIEGSLSKGRRGLPGGSSLPRLLSKTRNVRNLSNLPEITIEWIIARAREFRAKTGRWPTAKSGAIECSRETWSSVANALRNGRRGLSGMKSLFRLLKELD